MPFLTLTGEYADVIVPVAADGDGEVGQDLVGDPGDYTPDGTLRSTLRARPLRIPFTTRPMTALEAEDLRAVLEGPLPILAGGEWVELLGKEEPLAVVPGVVSWQQRMARGARRVTVRAELFESLVVPVLED